MLILILPKKFTNFENMKKKNGEQIAKTSEDNRDKTVETVRRAIVLIRSNEGENAKPTALKLQKLTGLSRSIFYKEHVLKEWNPRLCDQRYGDNKDVGSGNDEVVVELQELIQKLEKERDQLDKKMLKLNQELEKEKKHKEVYFSDLSDEKEKSAKLRGEILRLQQRLSIYG